MSNRAEAVFTVKVADMDLDGWADEYGIERGLAALEDFGEHISEWLADALRQRLANQGYDITTGAEMKRWSPAK